MITCQLYSLIPLAIFIVYGVFVMKWEKWIINQDLSSSILNDVADHWQLTPYVDAIVVSAPNTTANRGSFEWCPSAYPEFILERMFYGTR